MDALRYIVAQLDLRQAHQPATAFVNLPAPGVSFI
jgi:hypothetical protein